MKRAPWARAGLLAAAALLSACAGRAGPRPFGQAEGEIVIEVDNQNYLDVVVFGMQDHSAIRIGDVSGLSSATLPVPRQAVVVGRIRLLVDPIGSAEAYLTDEILVNPGNAIVLRVASMISMSSWSVRSRESDGAFAP